MEGPEIQFSEAVIDNGRFGKRVIRFETGRLAKQAAGAAMVYIDEETALLLSATTAGKHPREGFDFFPLTVRRRRAYVRRRPHPGLVLPPRRPPLHGSHPGLRLMDRPLRPAFVKGLRNEVQIVVTVLSINPDELYDVVAINASSMSTQLSGLPFSGPIGGVRVASSPMSTARSGLRSRSTPSWRTPSSTWSLPAASRRRRRHHDVEAEATDNSWNLIKEQGATAPTEEVVSEGLEAAKPFIKPSAKRSPTWQPAPPSRPSSSRSSWTTRTTSTPLWSPLPPRSWPRIPDRRQAGARHRLRRAQGRGHLLPGRPVRRPREGTLRSLPLRHQAGCAPAHPSRTRSASTAAA